MCHSNIVSHLYLVIIFLLVTACNDNVFIARPDVVEDVAVELEEFASKQIPYSSKKLKEIVISHGELCDNIIYNSSGNQIETILGTSVTLKPGSAGRVEIAGKAVALTVDLSVNEIVELYVGANPSKEPFTAQVILQYDTFRRIIEITVKPGEIFNVIFYEYPPAGEAHVSMKEDEVGSITYSNNTGNPMQVCIRPYQNVASTVVINICDGAYDMLDFDSAPPVWLITTDYDGQIVSYGEVPLLHGWQTIPESQRETAEEIYVLPAHSTYRFTVKVKVAKVISNFGIIAANSSLTTRFEAVMTVVEPVDYQIEYERID